MTLKSRQQGVENVNKAIAESERQMCELEMQKKNSVDEVDRLRKETLELENHIAMLDRKTSLYESLLLEVQFQKPSGDVCEETERNIMDITFQRQMEDEKSHCYFRLVHNLLCQYIGSETTWIKKYPTSRYIPTLLHDVGLVVSRCRLLGEEINLMKKWGCSEAGHPGHQLCGHTERPEDIVSSVTPAKNHLIKIVKRSMNVCCETSSSQ
ncbi:hypothetical protein J4Q44_G00320560 [Coregonus suidteri]|uniref:Knl1 C-terminal RWD domain-containing protein n=1 Tax=Coregonus suidteri TaxID=861788 RepID=A0AAN8KT03_9TELE